MPAPYGPRTSRLGSRSSFARLSWVMRRTRGAIITVVRPRTSLLNSVRRRVRQTCSRRTSFPRAAISRSARSRSCCRNRACRPLGPLALNTAAPDEGNMYLLGRIGSPQVKERFLKPMIEGRVRSAFFMTEPASLNGAGSDPSMLQTTATLDGNHWVINGQKSFITGALGAKVGIVMAKSGEGPSMFVVDLPDPAIRIEHVPNTIDNSMPGGHATVTIENLRVPADQMLGESGQGFEIAQLRLSPARLSHCMRWLGTCVRAHEIAIEYTNRRHAFGKPLIDHEGVGFMLAENLIDLKQSELMIDWCAGVLDSGSLGTVESSMTKVAVSEALMRVADRCVQVMGGTGVSDDTIVEQTFREVRAFRIYDGPTEVHKWSLAKKIKRDWRAANP